MHQLNQIETKMKEMESGRFQILCNEILISLGYGMVTNSGGQSGTDKTIKGTPDAYIFREDGSFIFVEYTVTQINVFSKFKSDISKCLDEEKTKVPIEKIDKVILMYNSILSVGEVNALSSLCKEKAIKFDKFDLSNLALLIHTRFPYLAKDFLGLNIDSGQFLDYKTFIHKNKHGMLSTPLDLELIGRETEIDEALLSIQRSSALVLSGKSGVGKTRIALEVLQRFEESNPEFDVWYVKDLGISLYDDLLKYTGNKKHIIFIDDINKLTAIDAILSYLADNKDRIKLLATVRDYALSSSLTKITNYIAESSVIKIDKVDDNIIGQIAKQNYGIENESYLHRIKRLSQGIPRLAVMMSILAVKENTLSSIDNVSMLLERYYDDVQKQLDGLRDEKKLKALGALSFLDKIHFEDTKSIEILCNLLSIDKSELIKQYTELLSMEMVDIYENEVVSISDQILSIFIFHYVFETKKILDYADFIKVYFPEFKNRIIQSINSIITYYDNLDFFSNCIKKVWDEWKRSGDGNFPNLMMTFWFVRETETLYFLSQKISGMKAISNLNDNYKLESKENINLDEVLSTLGQFGNSANYKMALDIILNYLIKDFSKIKEVSYTLINNFGYGRNSYAEGYVVQFDLIERLLYEIKNNNQKVMYQLFSNVASHLLAFDYEYTESLSGKSFSFTTIPLINYGKMPDIRNYIWKFISSCIQKKELRGYADNILDNYSAGKYFDNVDSDLYNYDFNKIIEEIISCLNLDSLEDCLLIDSIEQKVFRHAKNSFKMQENSKSNTFKTYKLLSSQPYDYDEDWSVGQEKRNTVLKNFSAKLEQENYYEFFNQCREIEELKRDNYDIHESISIILNEKPVEHMVDFLNAYLESNTPFNINPIELLQKMLSKYKYSIIKGIINDHSFDDKEYWLFSIISLIPTEMVDEYAYEELIEYFMHQEKVSVSWRRSLKFLDKFLKIDRDIYVTVCDIIIKKEDESLKRVYLDSIFRDEESFSSVVKLFAENYGLLVDVYLYLLSIGELNDRESKRFLILFKLNGSIIFDLIDTIFKRRKQTYFRRNINFDFSFLWGLDRQLILEVIDYIISNYCDYNIINLEKLFICKRKEQVYSFQDEIILDYIKQNIDNSDKMKTMFYLIATFSTERRILFINRFVELNPSIEDFKALPLSKQSESWSGSEIPLVNKKMAFLMKLNQELNGIKFLEHKAYIEAIIEEYEKSINRIKITEFLRDY